jgi:hypothetical protein
MHAYDSWMEDLVPMRSTKRETLCCIGLRTTTAMFVDGSLVCMCVVACLGVMRVCMCMFVCVCMCMFLCFCVAVSFCVFVIGCSLA